MKRFVGDQGHEIGTHRNPDLRAHRVQGVAEEVFDLQVLLEPLEEQRYLPTLLVDRGDGQGR